MRGYLFLKVLLCFSWLCIAVKICAEPFYFFLPFYNLWPCLFFSSVPVVCCKDLCICLYVYLHRLLIHNLSCMELHLQNLPE
uniref:Secreted protein n=1 Tax=Amblyomma triste TaxID=251400 RepID=A0A023G3N1_AMBTT